MKKYFKKGLSVFLSLLMVFTSLVFVVPELKAEAVSSGNYTVVVKIIMPDEYEMEHSAVTIKVPYYANNGTNTSVTTSTASQFTIAADALNDDYSEKSYTINCPGYPAKILFADGGLKSNNSMWTAHIHIQVTVNGTVVYNDTPNQASWAGGSGYHTFIVDAGDTVPNLDLSTDSDWSANKPYVKNINWVSADTNTQTIGKTANVSKTFKYNIVDQYGVVLSDTALTNLKATPSAAISGTKSGTIGTSGNIYHTYTNGTSNYQEVITATPNGQGETWDSQNITIKVTAGSLSSSKTYTLNDNTYTYKLDANTGSFAADDVISQTKAYYNTYGNLPTPTKTGYTFRGFYPAPVDTDFTDESPAEAGKLTIGTPMTSDTTWYASWKINSYRATFKYMTENGEVTSNPISANYGAAFDLPAYKDKVVYNDVEYTFTGWSPTLDYDEINKTAVMPAVSQTYEAQYDKKTLYADYTEVTAAINAANEVMSAPEYEAMYTEISRGAVTSAIAAVEYNLGLSKQSDVDGYADAINNAVAKLEKNKYVVLFLDDEGTIIKDGYHFVEYGTAVTVPAIPEKDYDADKHYTFDKWDEDTGACSYVTDDLVFTAQFTGTKHTYSTSTVDSTCTTDGSTLYDCTGCDHSYTVANGDTAGHTWETEKRVILSATCGTAGLKATYCSVCGAIDENSFETFTEESEHSWAEEEMLIEESCTGTGVYTKTCENCNKTEYRFVEPTGHTWENRPTVVSPTCVSAGYTITRCTTCWFASISQQQAVKDNHTLIKTTLEPTCTKPGYTKETCYYCDYESTVTTPTIAHNIPENWTTVREATCGADGILHKECTMCKGEDEYDSIPATGNHTWGEWAEVNAPKCGTMGLEKRKCQNCDAEETQAIEALEHSWVAYPANTKAPTCEETGFDAIICEHCGDTGGTLSSKLGHDYAKTASTEANCEAGPTETWTCKNDESHTYTIITGVPNEHNYGTGTIVTQATCTTPQISLYVCADCGDRYELATAVPNGHSYIDNWVVVTPATETENGQMVRYCTVCNTVPEYATIPATGAHSFVKGDYVAPDCETAGSQAWVCTTHDDCEENYVETIPATGHALTLDTKDASCTETGYVKVLCDECGEEIDSYEIPMLSHIYTEVEGSRQEASCTEPGSYKTACVCGDEKEIAIPATGHTYTTEDIAATCTTGAKTVYTCHCGHSYAITTSDPLGHDWSEWEETKEATETEAGELTRICKNNCGATETAPLAPTGEHNFVKDTEASVEATCDTAGTLVFKCTAEHDCGVTYTHKVEAKGHQLKLDFKQATCTEDGYAIVSCPVCHVVVETNTISKLGHKYTSEVTTEAECGKAGEITYTCENCGDTYTDTVDALEHSFIVEVAGTKVEPTCIIDGKVTMKCINCDETQEKVLPKTGHLYDDGTVIVAPDCVTAGKIEFTCQYDHTHKFTEVTQPTGQHTLVGEVVEYAETCTTPERHEQYCEACSNWVVVWESTNIPSHEWLDWVVEKLPTETEDGYQYRICDTCGAKEEMTLTAGRMFRVIFYNDNGERLTKPTEYTYGSKAERPETPVKPDDDVYTYEFLGWTYGGYDNSEVEKMLDYLGYGWDFSKEPNDDGYEAQEGCVKEMAVTAVYKEVEKLYAVTYVDGNGDTKVIEDVKHFEIESAYKAAYGTPVKAESATHTYTFEKWQIVCGKDKLTGEYVATATAQFIGTVKPGVTIEKEPSLFMKLINSILDVFRRILAMIGINI